MIPQGHFVTVGHEVERLKILTTDLASTTTDTKTPQNRALVDNYAHWKGGKTLLNLLAPFQGVKVGLVRDPIRYAYY